MVSSGMVWLIAAGGLSLPVFCQDLAAVAPIPSDPFEIANGDIQAATVPASRGAVLELLSRARNNYALRSGGQGYDLKVSFVVNSGGQTEYDGAWKMEDVFDPKLGLRWTAEAAAGYTITEISSHGKLYAEGTPASHIPLRLQEARAALFDAMPSSQNIASQSIRTSTAVFKGAPATCVLFSGAGAQNTLPGRLWEETEECVDPQLGLLQVHSQVPGRYYAYDYSNAPQLAGHTLPRKVTITEAGKVVSEISVESLTDLPAANPSLFVPTKEMKARGEAVAMAGALKISRIVGSTPLTPGATARPVCVFGLITASGQLVEAHSLQPSDPNSQAAVEAAEQMGFSRPKPPRKIKAPLRQHFVFIIATFATSQ